MSHFFILSPGQTPFPPFRVLFNMGFAPFLVLCFLIHPTNPQVILWGRAEQEQPFERDTDESIGKCCINIGIIVSCLLSTCLFLWGMSCSLSLSLSFFFFSPRESDHLLEVTTVYWLPSHIFGKRGRKALYPPPSPLSSLTLFVALFFFCDGSSSSWRWTTPSQNPHLHLRIGHGKGPAENILFSEESKNSTWPKQQHQNNENSQKERYMKDRHPRTFLTFRNQKNMDGT